MRDDESASDSNSTLVEGIDYYIDQASGYFVMTARYLLKRGHCCKNACRHCPYPKD